MNLLQLKYFQEVAKYQNITRTAEILHVSQPSLSTAIRHLEEELGIELFDRKGKSTVLNENGQNFLRDIRTSEPKSAEPKSPCFRKDSKNIHRRRKK